MSLSERIKAHPDKWGDCWNLLEEAADRIAELEASHHKAIQALHQVNATILKSPAISDTVWLMNDKSVAGTPLYDFIANEIGEARKALK
jgi:hypothetical protein